MKQQRLLKLSIVLLIPLTLLAVLMAAADLAGPVPTSDHNPTELYSNDTSDSLSIVARRVISIPFIIDNSALPTSAGDQVVGVSGLQECLEGSDRLTLHSTMNLKSLDSCLTAAIPPV